MADFQARRQGRAAEKASTILHELLRDYPARDFAIELWDGTRWEPEAGSFCRFTWHIHNPGVLRALLRPDRQVALSEAYLCGDFDISGDLLAVFPVADFLLQKQFTTKEKIRLGTQAIGLPRVGRVRNGQVTPEGRLHSKARDLRVVSSHYDVSNDFYRLWLDPGMVYSCAYFEIANDTLERAQEQKLEYICHKLRLKRGERLLDIGCGWGGLILHAASKHGVHAVGITLSQQQFGLAQERIAQAGLSSRCEVRLLDYRDAEQLGTFDKLVSVGMVEHVGEGKLAEYFGIAHRLLKSGGVFLNHGIGRAGNRPKPSDPTFTDIYIFPDGELVPLATMTSAAEHSGFEVRDVENLREHYYLTLVQWLRRLEANERRAKDIVGETKYRIWRLYLGGSAHYFRTGKLELYQTLLAKRCQGVSGLPMTRADWYS